MPLAALPWIIRPALPVGVHPPPIVLPGAILLGVAVAITATTFKKHV